MNGKDLRINSCLSISVIGLISFYQLDSYNYATIKSLLKFFIFSSIFQSILHFIHHVSEVSIERRNCIFSFFEHISKMHPFHFYFCIMMIFQSSKCRPFLTHFKGAYPFHFFCIMMIRCCRLSMKINEDRFSNIVAHKTRGWIISTHRIHTKMYYMSLMYYILEMKFCFL